MRTTIVVMVACVMLIAGRVSAQDRGGFTALVDFGAGVQQDGAIDESAFGLAGVGVGVGAFMNENLAVMFRIAGTTVDYDLALGEYGQTSGFVGPAAQYWLSDRFNVEAGAGIGFWRGDNDDNDNGFGLLLGAGYSLFNRGKHNVQFGVQYVPAFTEPGTVHSFGFTLGYQFQ